MDIDREVPQSGDLLDKIRFCLNQLEKANNRQSGKNKEDTKIRGGVNIAS